MNYQQAVEETRRACQAHAADKTAALRAMVRCATLAPSGHNTQCWRFRIRDDAIEVLPDWSRRTPVVDPDDHHLHVSLGCAIENLALAARAFGFEARSSHDAVSGSNTVTLAPAAAEETDRFRAIAERQCTRAEYDGKALANGELVQLEAAGQGRGVGMLVLTEHQAMERVLEYVVEGNTRQVGDPAFVRELEYWIRFSDREAVARGDGLSARATGAPPAPRWLGRWLFRAFFRARPEADKYARQIRSSAGIAVFHSAVDDTAHWVEAGRCYQRFALQATALGIRNAFLNQPVEASDLRPEFAAALGLDGARPDLVVRFGRGPVMPKSLRRPVDAVLD